MEDEESVDPEEQPQPSSEGEVEMPEDEALEEEEDPMVSIEVEVNNYLKSFKIFN